MRRARFILTLLVLTGVTVTTAGATAALTPTPTKADTTITLVTHDSFAVSKSVLAAFTKQTGIRVKILQAGDAGAALNQVILTKSNPIGDVFFGVDNTFLSRALGAGVFAKYVPTALARVPAEYRLDATHHLTPIDHGDVCINYDKHWFAHEKLAVPKTLTDLTKPRLQGLARRREPRHVVTGSCVPARDHRPVRCHGLARLLVEAPRQRRESRRRLGERLRR